MVVAHFPVTANVDVVQPQVDLAQEQARRERIALLRQGHSHSYRSEVDDRSLVNRF